MELFDFSDENEILSVYQLNSIVSDIIKADYRLSSVRVSGEITNCTRHSSGHIYLTLKDDLSRIRAVMFKHQAAYLKFKPNDGMKVVASGSIQVYQRGGEYQLYISSMEPQGEGALYAAFEALKRKLEEEGLFDAETKRKIPAFCKKIAVVTSPTGAAIRDILNVSKRRYPGINIVISPALVQGEEAPASIVNALRVAAKMPDLDCIIVARGGGSSEELWAFNDEEVARTIKAMPYPVVSAVGHEIDFTIADFVADLRAPTPSAAAEIVVPDVLGIMATLYNLKDRIKRAFVTDVERRRAKVKLLSLSRAMDKPKDLILERRLRLDEVIKNLDLNWAAYLDSRRSDLQQKYSVLTALDPRAVFGRGYAIVRKKSGEVVVDSKGLKVGEKLDVLLKEGEITTIVDEIKDGGDRL